MGIPAVLFDIVRKVYMLTRKNESTKIIKNNKNLWRRKMFVEERQEKILQLLHEDGKVKVKDLSKRFQVTEDCIRKDLASMENRSLLKRTYGGAVENDSLRLKHPNRISARREMNLKEKRKIAKKAVRLIEDGDVIFLDTSTANIELAREIIEAGLRVKVVSCMLDIANVFALYKDADFVLLGGEFYQSQNGFLGTMTLQMMEPFRFDKSFMGMVGADVKENIVTAYIPEDGAMKKAAIARSRQTYLMIENRKFQYHANYAFADFGQIDGVICETMPSEKVQKILKDKDVDII